MTNQKLIIKKQNYLSYLEKTFDKLDKNEYLDYLKTPWFYFDSDMIQHFTEELVDYFDIDIQNDEDLDLAYKVATLHYNTLAERDLI